MVAERRAAINWVIAIPRRCVARGLQEAAVAARRRPKHRRLGDGDIDHLRSAAVAGEADPVRIDKSCGGKLVHRILETVNAVDPDEALQCFGPGRPAPANPSLRSEEHTSELQSLMRISYAVFCLKKKKN